MLSAEISESRTATNARPVGLRSRLRAPSRDSASTPRQM